MKSYVIDFGHTNYKIGSVENNKIISIFKSGYHEHSIVDEITSKIQHIESSEILCCSVINESITNSIIEQLPNDISSLFKFIKVEDCENFISLAYKNNKERLGVDRVLNLIAASKKTEDDLKLCTMKTLRSSLPQLSLSIFHECGGMTA